VLIAVLLGAVAGCVDAISFDRVFGVFPANQSGNAALLGIDLGMLRGGEAWRPALAIAGFGIGVVVAILAGSRIRRRWRAELLLGAEMLLLVPLLVVVARDRRPLEQLSAVAEGCLLTVTSCAMGLQTEVIGRVAGISVATTYQTGAITRIAESVAARIAPGRYGQTVAAGIAVLVLVLIGYVGGAALGAALGSWRAAMVVPIAILATAAAISVGSARAR
jgi:uncharacterized membrane protein YoaK (UPF0700 family)